MEAPRRCTSCGAAPSDAQAAFCSYCGARLPGESEAPPPLENAESEVPPLPAAPPLVVPPIAPPNAPAIAPGPPPPAGPARPSQYGEGFPAFLKVAVISLALMLVSSTCCCVLWPVVELGELLQWLTGTP